MTKLKPWADDGAPESISHLISAARAERPSSESLSRALGAVAAGVVTASTTAAAGATLGTSGVSAVGATKSATLMGASAVKWLLLGVALGSTVVAGIEQRETSQGPAPTAVKPAERAKGPRSLTSAGPLPPPREAAPVAPELSLATTPIPAARPSPKLPSAASAEATVSPIMPPSPSAGRDAEQLAEEVRAMDAASIALKSGKTAQTLTALDDYEERYPQRRFAPEALYLRMEALVQLGRNAEARAIAERLVNAYPKSPQSARARLVLTPTIP